jgi:putative YphP/YqiW family bacilliredoxin
LVIEIAKSHSPEITTSTSSARRAAENQKLRCYVRMIIGGQRMYPELMVMPMREELTRLGIKEARTADEVDSAVKQSGTTMVVVNSICGCAAGKMRPAVRAALQNSAKPDQSITVFAGQDREATERARNYFTGYPPSSPSIGILRDGELVYMMQRSDIETSDPRTIALKLAEAFNQHCSKSTV